MKNVILSFFKNILYATAIVALMVFVYYVLMLLYSAIGYAFFGLAILVLGIASLLTVVDYSFDKQIKKLDL